MKIAITGFLRARPDCGSAYHESKWAAEEMVRSSGLEFTILKAGMIYGHGDHLVASLEGRLPNATHAVTGHEELRFSDLLISR